MPGPETYQVDRAVVDAARQANKRPLQQNVPNQTQIPQGFGRPAPAVDKNLLTYYDELSGVVVHVRAKGQFSGPGKFHVKLIPDDDERILNIVCDDADLFQRIADAIKTESVLQDHLDGPISSNDGGSAESDSAPA